MDGRMDARPLHCAYRAMRRAIAFLRHFVFFRLQIKYLTLNTNKYVVEVAES